MRHHSQTVARRYKLLETAPFAMISAQMRVLTSLRAPMQEKDKTTESVFQDRQYQVCAQERHVCLRVSARANGSQYTDTAQTPVNSRA